MSDHLPGGMPPATRDLLGHAGKPPVVRWPGDARLALSIVVNVEEGAELSLASGDERNESVHEVAREVVGAPDLCMESHFAYGARVGIWRVMDALDAHGMKATFNSCGRCIAATPILAAEPARRGHEISAHGWRWESHAGMTEERERAVIAATVKAIESACGVRPVGWHTKSSASVNTRRLLLEEGGFLYDSDCYDDDIPRTHRREPRPHVILPYAFDTNDMRFSPGGGFVQPRDLSEYCIRAIERLLKEGATHPKMLSIGLHLRFIGRPGRIGGLETILEHVAKRSGIWVARRRDIAEHWLGTGL